MPPDAVVRQWFQDVWNEGRPRWSCDRMRRELLEHDDPASAESES